jgi:hypothetical protein
LGAKIGITALAALAALCAVVCGFVTALQRPGYPVKGAAYILGGIGLLLSPLLLWW